MSAKVGVDVGVETSSVDVVDCTIADGVRTLVCC